MGNKVLNLQAGLENSYFLKDSLLKEVHLYISIKGSKAPETEKRTPLNISLVVDRSGSMSGEKLNYVKKALDFVVNNLSKEDFLSIVQYDNQVDVVSASTKIRNKKSLHKKIKAIRAGGATNLSGGMLEGYNQVNSTKKPGFVNRNLLLSDGLANNGITDPAKLQQIAQKKFREEGIALSTFGVGAGFNELLMTNLAEYGGANYYFIENPDQIPQIFANELSGLLSVVAQNTLLEINFPKNILKAKKAYGYLADLGEGKVKINLNDVFSEEQKDILITFELKETPTEVIPFEINLSYEDVIDTMSRITEQQMITLTPTTDTELFENNIQKNILQQVALFIANDLFEQAILIMDRRDFEGAKKVIQNIKIYLEEQFKFIAPNEELKKQYDEILKYEQKIEEMKNMPQMDYMMAQKASRSANYLSKKKKL